MIHSDLLAPSVSSENIVRGVFVMSFIQPNPLPRGFCSFFNERNKYSDQMKGNILVYLFFLLENSFHESMTWKCTSNSISFD